MRSRLYIVMIGLILCGCEVIDEKDRLLPVPIPTMSDGRIHVLVEFTGFRCVNCPSAAQTAQALKDIYEGRLVVVALHPESNPFTQGLYDYTCPEADEVYRFMGGTATTPFPTGNIDMQATGNGYFIDPIEWTARLRTVMADTVWNPHSRYDVSYWLVEDSVLGAQAMPDGSVNMHYYHRHVLRAISATPFEQVPEKCDPAQCSVVTVYSDTNDKHILHAYETPFDLSAHR